MYIQQMQHHPQQAPTIRDKPKTTITLHIGEYFASTAPRMIYTILGSCVSVCLFDTVRRIGGMNHIMLPGRADFQHFNTSARFGINAMELLINLMLKRGANRPDMIAKVFGGGALLCLSSPKRSIGLQNIDFTFDFLNREQIPVTAFDVGGHCTRRVYFETHTGDVLIRRPNTNCNEFGRKENKIPSKIKQIAYEPAQITLWTR